MTIAPAPIVSRPSGVPRIGKGSRLLETLRTTDHKTIGLMYLTTALTWGCRPTKPTHELQLQED